MLSASGMDKMQGEARGRAKSRAVAFNEKVDALQAQVNEFVTLADGMEFKYGVVAVLFCEQYKDMQSPHFESYGEFFCSIHVIIICCACCHVLFIIFAVPRTCRALAARGH